MTKLSDAARLSRLLAVLQYLATVDHATVGELARRFHSSSRSLYEDLVVAWLAEDPEHVGLYPFHLHVEHHPDGADATPVEDRWVWVDAVPTAIVHTRAPG